MNVYNSSLLLIILFIFKIESMESLRERLQFFMHQYNEATRGSGLDLVFFEDAIISLIKVCLFFMFVCLFVYSHSF